MRAILVDRCVVILGGQYSLWTGEVWLAQARTGIYLSAPGEAFANIHTWVPPPSDPGCRLGTCRQLPLPLPLSALELNQILTRSR